MGYNLLINGIYRGYNPLILTIYYLPGTSQWDTAGVLLNFFLPGTGGFFWWESFVGFGWLFGGFFFENLVNLGRVKWAPFVVYGI